MVLSREAQISELTAELTAELFCIMAASQNVSQDDFTERGNLRGFSEASLNPDPCSKVIY